MDKAFRTIKNALIMPLEGSMDAFRAGVFSNGRCLEESLQRRAAPALPRAPEEHWKGAYIYGGFLFGHYGHFLLESLSRLYGIRQCPPGLPILFCSPNPEIIPAQRAMCKRLGLRNELRLVSRPVQVDTLVLSPPGSGVEPDFILQEQIEALGVFKADPARGEERLWLSRSTFPGGGVINEPLIEEELGKAGWSIFHPEDVDIPVQVQRIASARHVAGFDGSAFFNALLAQKIYGRFFLFGRRNFVAPALPCMLAAKGVPFEEHVFAVEHVEKEGGAARYRLLNPEALLRVLKA